MTNSVERYVAACKRAGFDSLLAEAEAWADEHPHCDAPTEHVAQALAAFARHVLDGVRLCGVCATRDRDLSVECCGGDGWTR